jgi:hypothetical protein
VHDGRLHAEAPGQSLIVFQAINTVAELNAIGARTICVPAPRVLDDQRARAEAFASVHPWLKVCATSANELDAAYAALLAGPSPEPGGDASGSRIAASHLLSLLARTSLG